MCGVSAVNITKLSKTILEPAIYGKKIDLDHPAAIAYLKLKSEAAPRVSTKAPATGIDPLYEDAIKFCEETARYSSRAIRTHFRIGTPRSDAILATMTAAGLVPEGLTRQKRAKKPPAAKPEAETKKHEEPKKKKSRGLGALKENKKAESLAALAAKEKESIEAPAPPPEPPDNTAPPQPPPGPDVIDIPNDIGAFIDMTLREVIQRFGTDAAFCDWLKATKEIEAIEEKRLKNAQTRGELVSRKLVKIGVIEPIDAAHIKLLTDGAKTIARRSTAMHGAGRTVEDIEKFVSEQMTSFIRPVKSRVAKALRNA